METSMPIGLILAEIVTAVLLVICGIYIFKALKPLQGKIKTPAKLILIGFILMGVIHELGEAMGGIEPPEAKLKDTLFDHIGMFITAVICPAILLIGCYKLYKALKK